MAETPCRTQRTTSPEARSVNNVHQRKTGEEKKTFILSILYAFFSGSTTTALAIFLPTNQPP